LLTRTKRTIMLRIKVGQTKGDSSEYDEAEAQASRTVAQDRGKAWRIDQNSRSLGREGHHPSA
jgi:hypothetical protein